MAPARCRGRDQCFQFSGRGLVVERGPGRGLRRRHGLESFEKTPLTAIAVTKIAERVCRETGADPAIFTLLMGDRKTVGQKLSADKRIPLISATGSTQMGVHVAQTVHGRLGKTIMELGGNNALIVCPSADLEMATQSIFFGAVGTAGQRCTSTRRVIMHESIADKVRKKLLAHTSRCELGIRSIARR